MSSGKSVSCFSVAAAGKGLFEQSEPRGAHLLSTSTAAAAAAVAEEAVFGKKSLKRALLVTVVRKGFLSESCFISPTASEFFGSLSD